MPSDTLFDAFEPAHAVPARHGDDEGETACVADPGKLTPP